MNLVFVGTAEFAVPSLRAVHEAGHRIPLVVTQPDRPGHRLRMSPPPVRVAAQALGLAVAQPERIREPESVARIQAAAPEVIVVVAYGQIIPPAVLEIPAQGVLNLHASLLPRHRGAAPVAHAILAGDKTTGVTVMKMDDQLDHGPLLAQHSVEIGAHEDAAALSGRLSARGAELLVKTLAELQSLEPQEQDHAAATLAPKLSRSAGELEWTLSAEEIDRRVRAFATWPGATLPWAGSRIKVIKGSPVSGQAPGPGQVGGVVEQGLVVGTGVGAYRLETVQLPGRRPVSARLLAVHG